MLLIIATRLTAFAATFLLSTAAGQQNLTFDPNTIDLTIRSQWCQAEFSTCRTLCSGTTNVNDCLATTLEFDCLCTTNNSAPGLQYYTQTMPTFICEEEYQKCISEATNNAGAQAACAATEKAECGHLDPANFTAVAASPSATASSSRSIPPSKATSSSTSTSPQNSATSLQPHQSLSTGAKAGIGVGVAFGVLTFILGLWLAFWYGRRTRSSANDKKSKPDKKAELEASEARKPELADTGISEMGEPLSSEEKKELENRRRAVELEGGSINVPPGFSERTELEARRRGDVFELS